MFPEKWLERCSKESCPFCLQMKTEDVKDDYGFPVVELASGRLRLMRNQPHYGYCILISRHHVLELHDLSSEDRETFIHDVARVSKAIQNLRGAAKMNVQILGNGIPHLHAHVVPRYLNDEDFGKYPKDKSKTLTELEPAETQELITRLRTALA